MKRTRQPHTATLTLPALRLEGALLLPGVLEKAAAGHASKQALADYGIPKGLTINDECSRAFQIACALWQDFAAHLQRADAALDAAPRTTSFIHELLRDAFGYTLQPASTCEADELLYPVTFLAGSLPVLCAPHTLGLDEPHTSFAPQGGGSRKKTAFQSLQELLTASGDMHWGVVSNGRQLRLLRDAASLTRPSYLEIDLADLLGGQHWAEFKSLWLILHASRAPQGSTPDSIWEDWRTQGQNEGARIRDGLRHNVESALTALGEGFIAHPANHELRQRLHSGDLPPRATTSSFCASSTASSSSSLLKNAASSTLRTATPPPANATPKATPSPACAPCACAAACAPATATNGQPSASSSPASTAANPSSPFPPLAVSLTLNNALTWTPPTLTTPTF